MKVLHVAIDIPSTSGGPTRSIKGLCRSLSHGGIEVGLLVLHGRDEFENPCGVKVYYGEDGFDASQLVRRYDLVHVHGMWHPSLHKSVAACKKAGVPYVISPRGMLDPWALSVKPFKKRIARLLFQDRDLRGAAAIHVTAEAEAEHVRIAGFTNKIIISPNGVDVPDEGISNKGKRGKKIALFLSRLHPGKGLMALAEAWAKGRPQGWDMRVVGPDSYGHKAEVVSKLRSLGIEGDWQFRDMVDDKEKWREYAAADLLVHPSVSENFGITIAEGLAAGLPVICTKGTPWSDIEARKCGWWIDIGAEPLAIALRNAFFLDDATRCEMGAQGRELVEEKYTWDAVVKAMVKGYEGVLNGDNKPEGIR